MKSSKVLPNPNSEINILKNTVQGAITKLNNYLIVNEQSHRYKLTWSKGEGEVVSEFDTRVITHYYRLDLVIDEGNGNVIPIYGGNYPIESGVSQIRINEAEIQAYKDIFIHGIGHLISVQHSIILQGEAAERQKEEQSIQAEKDAIDKGLKQQQNKIIL